MVRVTRPIGSTSYACEECIPLSRWSTVANSMIFFTSFNIHAWCCFLIMLIQRVMRAAILCRWQQGQAALKAQALPGLLWVSFSGRNMAHMQCRITIKMACSLLPLFLEMYDLLHKIFASSWECSENACKQIPYHLLISKLRIVDSIPRTSPTKGTVPGALSYFPGLCALCRANLKLH